jgi:ABC-2 type transport system permease protein
LEVAVAAAIAMSSLASGTAFAQALFFPVSIYVGKSTGAELYQGLAIQFFWVVAAYGFARFMWARGIRKYSAVGG